MRKKLTLVTSLFILAFILYSCKDSSNDNQDLRSVLLVTPQSVGGTEKGSYSGVVEEGKNVNASFMADGKLLSLMVKEGDRVTKGQLLAVLDDTDYQIGVNQLRAQYNQMTEEKKRIDEMFRRENIAPNDYEKFSAGYEQLRLQMEMAENKLGYTKLFSPSNGYISEKFKEPGEIVGAGTPIFKITDDNRLLTNVDLPVSVYLKKDEISGIKGYSVVFPEVPIPLTIESFTPDPANNMIYQMKLLIPHQYVSSLSPGMNMRVEIEMRRESDKGYKIPVRAIYHENGQNYVWIYQDKDSTLHKKEVTVESQPYDKWINVLGIDNSEQIVETGVKQLYEGEKVHVIQNRDYGL